MNIRLFPHRASHIRRLIVDKAGAAIVEFAILAPLFFLMLLGILQVGIWMQNYNAVQSLASDSARFVMIQYQRENELSDEQIRSVILANATGAQYLLDSDRINITVDRSGTSRVSGTTEIDISITYRLSDWLPGVDLPGSTIEYERPVWVIT